LSLLFHHFSFFPLWKCYLLEIEKRKSYFSSNSCPIMFYCLFLLYVNSLEAKQLKRFGEFLLTKECQTLVFDIVATQSNSKWSSFSLKLQLDLQFCFFGYFLFPFILLKVSENVKNKYIHIYIMKSVTAGNSKIKKGKCYWVDLSYLLETWKWLMLFIIKINIKFIQCIVLKNWFLQKKSWLTFRGFYKSCLFLSDYM
jgi:hypothetical protein